MARACGIKPGETPSVLDATAGLGRDAWVTASLGCEVLAVESNPIVHALLKDGLTRALDHPQSRHIASRIQLRYADAHALIPTSDRFDTIYLDPMFPHRNKTALVKNKP